MLGSTIAKNAALDACYGDNHSSVWPSSVYLGLYVGDPTVGGTELPSTGGYAAIEITNNSSNFPDAVGGLKSNGVALAYGSSSAAWGGVATYWWFTDGDGNLLDGGPLQTPIIVDGADTVVQFEAGLIVIGS